MCALLASVLSAAAPDEALADGDRIHVLMFPYSADCIVLESDGRFGIVDCAEDDLYPDGSDPRYPVREGVSHEERSNTEQVLSYLDSIGATPENVEFLIGTHPHSDHIANAPQIIERYLPERVYTPEYSDDYLTNPGQLWDNQFVYDRLITAAEEAGSALVLRFDPEAPVVPEEGSVLGCSEFDLGSMHITLLNTDESYKETKVYGANAFSLGVLVEVNGQRAFLAGDINNISEESGGKSSEDKLVPIVGHVNVFKMGHHGNKYSNTEPFLSSLSPDIAVQTGKSYQLTDEAKRVLIDTGSAYYCTDLALEQGVTEIVVEMTEEGSYVSNVETMPIVLTDESDGVPRVYLRGELYEYTGYLANASQWWYFNGSSRAAVDEWVDIDGVRYRFGGNGKPVTGWFQEKATWYYLGASGAMRTGWLQLDGTWYYLDESGAMRTGWQKINDSWYYFKNSGAMHTGWLQLDGTWYYLDPAGAMHTGWLKSGSAWYWFSSGGAMATGWKQIDGAWYNFSSNGAMNTGWLKSGSTRYLLSDSGAMRTGWVQKSGKWYFFKSSGAMVTGWLKSGGKWYYLDSNGAMRTGWVSSKGSWYYLKSGGAMATGWLKLSGNWRYFHSSGHMATGWQKIGGTWYYFRSSGSMATGWVTISGKRYYFDSSGAWNEDARERESSVDGASVLDRSQPVATAPDRAE